jgi:RNA polymerase-binding protein
MRADRVMRTGSRLGALSYETARNRDLAPRQIARYRTEKGEEFDMPFAADAEVPGTWLCRNGMEGTLIEGGDPVEPPGTCCGNAARSRNSTNCSRNASRSSSQSAAAANSC